MLSPEVVAEIERQVAERCDGEHVYVHDERSYGIALIMHGEGFVLRCPMSPSDLAVDEAGTIRKAVDAICEAWDQSSPERERQREWDMMVEMDAEECAAAESDSDG